jgi:hypothetical protein
MRARVPAVECGPAWGLFGGNQMRGERQPGHAGPLARWERIAIVVIVVLMAALIIAVTLAATP